MHQRYWEHEARAGTVISMSKANIILLTATTQNAASLAEFLDAGAQLVADTGSLAGNPSPQCRGVDGYHLTVRHQYPAIHNGGCHIPGIRHIDKVRDDVVHRLHLQGIE